MIISLLQTKGGTGKTTLAKCLAYSKPFLGKYKSIGLVELDPQGTLQDWYGQRKDELKRKDGVEFVNIAETDATTQKNKLKALHKTHGLLILDTPGESTSKETTRLAASISDLVLLPLRSSTNDEMSFERHILPVIRHVIDVASNKRNSFFIIPTFVNPRANAENIVEYFKSVVPEYVHCLNCYLPTRSVYENFSRDGLTLYDYKKLVMSNQKQSEQAQKAIQDIELIAKAILTS